MDAKKFTNLTGNYKPFLTKIDSLLVEINKDTKLSKLYTIHNTIETIAKENDIYTNDINRLLIYCDNPNPTIKKLKEFTYLKNIKLIEKAIKDSKYKTLIKTLIEECIKQKKNVNEKKIERTLVLIWNKYFPYWNGFWKYITYEKGMIKKIEFFDPTDIEELIKLV